MNLEEKASEYGARNYIGSEQIIAADGFHEGYTQCKTDLIEFLQANQKATVKQVLEHLNGMK